MTPSLSLHAHRRPTHARRIQDALATTGSAGGEDRSVEFRELDWWMMMSWVGTYIGFNLAFMAWARVCYVHRTDELKHDADAAGFMTHLIAKGSEEALTPSQMRRQARARHEKRRSAENAFDSVRKLVEY